MSRQVRLDDDVCALVEAYQAAEGLPSLSSSANRILRLAAGPEEEPTVADALAAGIEMATPAVTQAARAAVAIVTPRSRRRPRAPTRRPAASPNGALAGCPHPLLERRDSRCGRCGATM